MTKCIISLGANLGDPASAIAVATKRLVSELTTGHGEFRCSPLYRTPPVGGPSGQPPFINAVLALETQLNAWEAWRVVRQVENELGRVRQTRWEARKIDVDILLLGSEKIWTPQLKIPHPRMCMRRFIVLPAADVASEVVEPVSQLSIAELAGRLRGPSSLFLWADETAQAIPIAEAAARATGAKLEIVDFSSLAAAGLTPQDSANPHVEVDLGDTSRRISVIQKPNLNVADIGLGLPRVSGLHVYLAARTAEGALWEDYHRPAATTLGMTAASQRSGEATALGFPRYLLSGDDRDWAIHELVAALQAMDCPIEPIPL